MARKRPGRVRTKNTNRRPALLLSAMAPEDFNVRPNETKSIACPDCRTWRRITGDTVLRIREHPISEGLAQDDEHTNCPGSYQLVVIDIDVRRWQVKQDRLLRDAMPQANRRAAQQIFKPPPAPAVPVARMKAEVTLETARQSYFAHRKGCASCVHAKHCQDGGLLASRYVTALRNEPTRLKAREQQEFQDRRDARKRTAPTVRHAQWAKHGGARTETANNQCADRLHGSRSEFSGPQLPLAPRDAEAHDRRQTELGKQYSRRNQATSVA
ncbi:hypothetical protein [Streptomyces sp. bgisy091]|uniref:hypothetical protein n=1 Tax=Streptomyces sp. bgisy091 TaxID=3413778 RepID=UPI003D705C5C